MPGAAPVPGLAAALRRSPRWTQVSTVLHGENKLRCNKTLRASAEQAGKSCAGSGFSGHFRAVQGFRYLGEAPVEEPKQRLETAKGADLQSGAEFRCWMPGVQLLPTSD